MTEKLSGTALVTGASSGIGRELAILLAEAGCGLVLVSRNESALGTLADDLAGAHGVAVRVIAGDLGCPGAAARVFDRCREAGVAVDILVNNAGVGWYGDAADMTPDRVEAMVGLNVTSLAVLCSLFGQGMRERRRGWILNVSSIVALAPFPHFALYSALKACVTSYSRALGEELRPAGVTVTCLHPGQTATNFFDAAGGRTVREGMLMDPRRVARIGLDGLRSGRREIIPGFMNNVFGAVMPVVPARVIGSIMHKTIGNRGRTG